MHAKLFFALLLLACAGCSSSSAVDRGGAGAQPDGGEAPPEPIEKAKVPYCEDVARPIDAEADTPLGVEGADLLAALLDRASGSVSWLSEGEAGFDVSVEADERSLRFVEGTEVYPENSAGIAIFCSDSLAVDGVVSLKTDDGRLDQSLPTTFFLSADNVDARRVTFTINFADADLGPAFDLADFVDTSRYDEVFLSFSGIIEAGSFSGKIDGVRSFSDGVTAGASLFQLATFSAE